MNNNDIIRKLEVTFNEAKKEILSLRDENNRLEAKMSKFDDALDIIPDEDYQIYQLSYLVINGSSDNYDIKALKQLLEKLEFTRTEERVLIKKQIIRVLSNKKVRRQCYDFTYEFFERKFKEKQLQPNSFTWELILLILRIDSIPKDIGQKIIKTVLVDECRVIEKYYNMCIAIKVAIQTFEYSGYIPDWYMKRWLKN